MTRLKECSFEPSHSLTDYALYICHLWSALVLCLNLPYGAEDVASSLQPGHASSTGTSEAACVVSDTNDGAVKAPGDLPMGQEERESVPAIITQTKYVAESDECSSVSHPPSVDKVASTKTERKSTSVCAAVDSELQMMVADHIYQLAFSLCNGLFLQLLDATLMKQFNEHLNVLETEAMKNLTGPLPELDIVSVIGPLIHLCLLIVFNYFLIRYGCFVLCLAAVQLFGEMKVC